MTKTRRKPRIEGNMFILFSKEKKQQKTLHFIRKLEQFLTELVSKTRIIVTTCM